MSQSRLPSPPHPNPLPRVQGRGSARLLPLPLAGEGWGEGERVCALLTCFNRRDKTLACLHALARSTGLHTTRLSAVLVDDGSSDGTAQAVRDTFPWVHVVQSSAALFWCRGMHLAFDTALRSGFDHYLWLNDDTLLQPDALARLLASEAQLRQQAGAPVIVVGSTTDAVTGRVTYGGELLRSRWKPLRVERVQPANTAQRCDSMNGNIVLLSADVARRVGNVDPVFEHSMGDTDYALRAGKLGVQVWVDAGVHGHCSANPSQGSWCDRSQPFAARWKNMHTRKGLPWRSWLALTRRHAGPLWPLYFVLPYLKVIVQSAMTPHIRSTKQRSVS